MHTHTHTHTYNSIHTGLQAYKHTHTITANEINFCIFVCVCVCASVFLTSWTSPKAPLPITLTTSKSSPRMRCVLTISTLFESETLWSWNLYTLCFLWDAVYEKQHFIMQLYNYENGKHRQGYIWLNSDKLLLPVREIWHTFTWSWTYIIHAYTRKWKKITHWHFWSTFRYHTSLWIPQTLLHR